MTKQEYFVFIKEICENHLYYMLTTYSNISIVMWNPASNEISQEQLMLSLSLLKSSGNIKIWFWASSQFLQIMLIGVFLIEIWNPGPVPTELDWKRIIMFFPVLEKYFPTAFVDDPVNFAICGKIPSEVFVPSWIRSWSWLFWL